jgi:Na+-translocating ferredoxin:NAD+ oxidoreductase RnfD subunit
MLWLSLAALGAYATLYLVGIESASLIFLPLVAVIVDLVFQRIRFEELRIPDAAIATGLFVALLLPPTVSFPLAAGLAALAVAIRHVLRFRGRPWFNPAAVAVLLGSFAFGTLPAWWVAVGPYAQYVAPAVGLGLLAVGASRWRLPAAFLAAYAGFAILQHALLGASLDARVLVLQTLDPTTLFFALFMVPEPRSAPTDRDGQILYGALIGIVAAFAPIAFPTTGLLIALVLGNLVAIGLRARSPTVAALPVRRVGPIRKVRAADRAPARPARWSLARRTGAGIAVLIALVAMIAVGPGPSAHVLPPGGGAAGATLGGCSQDNPAIPASTLAQLHQMLGPSVIRSYDSSTGVVVFYDPVNHVTVTETDLFEDYGYAEFNGDDYAVSGCSA